MITQAQLLSSYLELSHNLNCIFHNRELAQAIQNKKEFQSIIERQLNILGYLAEQTDRTNDAYGLVNIYKQITHQNNFTFQQVSGFDDEYDLIDEMNYLKVYLKNTFKINDVDQISQNLNDGDLAQLNNASFQHSSSEDDASGADESSEATNASYQAKSAQAFYNQAFGAFSANQAGGDDGFKQLIARKLASERLSADVRAGSFYLYKTKPREILFINYFLLVLFSLLAIAFFSLIVMIFISNSYFYESSKVAHILDIKNPSGNITIFDYPFVVWPSFIFVFLIYKIYKLYHIMFVRKNDNDIYYINSRSYLLFLVLIVIYVIYSFVSGANLQQNIFALALRFSRGIGFMNIHSTDNMDHSGFYYGIYVLGLIVAVLMGFVLLSGVASVWLNPKRDLQKIDAALDRYQEKFLQ